MATPNYLNQLRFLVLSNIMLEAMACRIPVLATPVGAIPDVIIDGNTGSIMENNSPNLGQIAGGWETICGGELHVRARGLTVKEVLEEK
jgi:glycosyltransferase involved in cell wall biosynthesis